MTYEDYLKVVPIKPNSHLRAGNTVILCVREWETGAKNGVYEKVKCNESCGRDEFGGYDTTGKYHSWSDNDTFKIIE